MTRPVAVRTGFDARDAIAAELAAYLAKHDCNEIVVSDSSVAPPLLAYMTHFPRLTVVLGGRHDMIVPTAGEPCPVRPGVGDAVFIPANCWNTPRWNQPVREMTFLFGREHIGVSLIEGRPTASADGPAAGAPRALLKTSVHCGDDDVISSLLAALSASCNRGDAGRPVARAIVASLLQACLSLLNEPQAPQPGKAQQSFDLIRLYIQQHAQGDVTRESVAEAFRLTPNHVSRLFRQRGSMQFSDYVTYTRLSRAKLMLGQYGMPLKEVARSCGFASTAYFCRSFKRFTKMTPTEYRARACSTEKATAVSRPTVSLPRYGREVPQARG